jgi:hypothetical protein
MQEPYFEMAEGLGRRWRSRASPGLDSRGGCPHMSSREPYVETARPRLSAVRSTAGPSAPPFVL